MGCETGLGGGLGNERQVAKDPVSRAYKMLKSSGCYLLTEVKRCFYFILRNNFFAFLFEQKNKEAKPIPFEKRDA